MSKERCTAYCVGSELNLGEEGEKILPDVLCDREEGKIVFHFACGVLVFWGYEREEEMDIVDKAVKHTREALPIPEYEEMSFSFGKEFRIGQGHISLVDADQLVQLAISYGMVQSIKLDVLERAIQGTIAKAKQIPSELAKKGRIFLSRSQLAKMVGEVFLERNHVNLSSDVLDTPDFFWEHPELESYFVHTTHYLEVNKRGELLNKRLAVLHDLLQILVGELHHQHSSRLEWTIIVLILIEIVLALWRDWGMRLF